MPTECTIEQSSSRGGVWVNYQFEQHFTLEEANALLPMVRTLFAEVHTILNQNGTADPPHHHAGTNGHSNGNGRSNGQSKPSEHYSSWPDDKRREAAYRLLNALQQRGIVIQDVERGLIDFPAIVAGREVFLCYELRDGHAIEYCHDIDAGYAGRKKITELPR